jgi:hypothetical protein
MDLKGLPPTPERFIELLKLFAAVRYNFVLVEWEDTFPWTVDERFRSPTAYTPEQIQSFCATAAELGLELIPLVTCLGHMETPLSIDDYAHLREVQEDESSLNPIAPGARELIQGMVDDVLKLMPDVKRFHLGGDEAVRFGQHPDCVTYIEEHGKGALYMHHVEPILDSLNARGVRPILWHDMMIDWDSAALESLAAKADLMPWAYHGHPDTNNGHCTTKIIQRFKDHGITLWGAGAYKGAEGHDADLPDNAKHTENALAWVDMGKRLGLVGVVATAWSRFAVDTVQCNPIDSSLDSLVNVAVILHNGKTPEGGIEACVEALADVGEKERFEACRKSMERVANARAGGWDYAQKVRMQLVLGQNEPRRSSALSRGRGFKCMGYLESIVNQTEKIADEVRAAFDGLMDPIWIEEYLITRFKPLRDELADIHARL